MPEIAYRLNKFNFYVALYVRKTASANDTANHIPALLIGKNNLLSGRQRARNPQNSAIIKYDDGPTVLP
jgi:hypothetical protein